MKRRLYLIIAAVMVLAGLFANTGLASAEGFDIKPLIDAGMNIEEVHIGIPNCRGTYHFLWVSDLHIVIVNDEVAQDDLGMVQGRIGWSATPEGKPAGEYWLEELADLIESVHADAVFFGGDMLDLCTAATVDCLREGLARITAPYMYIRADHDYGKHWTAAADEEKNRRLQQSICPYEATCCMEYEDFCVLGINDTTRQLSEEGLKQATEVFDKGKPIIIITHVPYDSEVDVSLNDVSRAAWSDRNLTWGPNAHYVPKEATQGLMELVRAEDSPVKEVLAGHLHLTWDGYITGTIQQHVFSPAYGRYIGVINVDGNVE